MKGTIIWSHTVGNGIHKFNVRRDGNDIELRVVTTRLDTPNNESQPVCVSVEDWDDLVKEVRRSRGIRAANEYLYLFAVAMIVAVLVSFALRHA
jgi:hypothetical protein